jgi:hypothetical protein
LIQQQEQQLTQYRQRIDRDQSAAIPQRAQLQQQGRTAQYRYQEDYLGRLRQQQLRVRSDRDHNYRSDAYFYTAPTHRYARGGRYYETNQYGVNILNRALNYGYAEGFRTGQADRQDRWRSDYEYSYAYQDASYGYDGYYVAPDDYSYYFREGFRRGYEDGYYSRYRYGRYEGGGYTMFGAILTQILGLQLLR